MLGHIEAPQYIVCLEKAVVAFFKPFFSTDWLPLTAQRLNSRWVGLLLTPRAVHLT